MTSLQSSQRQLTVPLEERMAPNAGRVRAACAREAASRTSAWPNCEAAVDTHPVAAPAERGESGSSHLSK
eukprot:15474499-Alexandrium_andersonii.AAC.1